MTKINHTEGTTAFHFTADDRHAMTVVAEDGTLTVVTFSREQFVELTIAALLRASAVGLLDHAGNAEFVAAVRKLNGALERTLAK